MSATNLADGVIPPRRSGTVTLTGTYQVAVVYRGTSQYKLSYHMETLTVNPKGSTLRLSEVLRLCISARADLNSTTVEISPVKALP
jgi:hypothetical protein